MSTRERASRFALVGVLNTAIDLGLFAVLQPIGGILFANTISTSCGMIFSFLVNGRYTFGQDRLDRRQAARFFVFTAANLWLFQALVIWGLVTASGQFFTGQEDMRVLAAKVVGICIGVVVNFVGYHHWVWPREEVRSER